ncbi:MAG: helix-turn-helix domain-containing protein [Bacteroidales bacterium]
MSDRPNYFAVIPATVRYDDSLQPLARLLYGEITALSNIEGFCYASNAYFAKLYNVETNTISAWINALAKAGHVTTVIDKDSGNKRRIYISDPITKNRDTLSRKIVIPITKNREHINTSIITDENNITENLQNELFELPKVTRETVFSDSLLFDPDVFCKSFSGVKYAGVDINYYWQSVHDWSEGNRKIKRTARGWEATVRTFMRGDKNKGKLVMLAKSEQSQQAVIDYLNI